MSEPIENTCSQCQALMAPTMSKCPRCGASRVLPVPPLPPVDNASYPRQATPKSTTGMNQDIFGPNGIWVALALYFGSSIVAKFGFVGIVVSMVTFLFAYIINVGWTMRRASDKGYPYLGFFGIIPVFGPIIIACVPRKAGFESAQSQQLRLAQGSSDIVFDQPYGGNQEQGSE